MTERRIEELVRHSLPTDVEPSALTQWVEFCSTLWRATNDGSWRLFMKNPRAGITVAWVEDVIKKLHTFVKDHVSAAADYHECFARLVALCNGHVISCVASMAKSTVVNDMIFGISPPATISVDVQRPAGDLLTFLYTTYFEYLHQSENVALTEPQLTVMKEVMTGVAGASQSGWISEEGSLNRLYYALRLQCRTRKLLPHRDLHLSAYDAAGSAVKAHPPLLGAAMKTLKSALASLIEGASRDASAARENTPGDPPQTLGEASTALKVRECAEQWFAAAVSVTRDIARDSVEAVACIAAEGSQRSLEGAFEQLLAFMIQYGEPDDLQQLVNAITIVGKSSAVLLTPILRAMTKSIQHDDLRGMGMILLRTCAALEPRTDADILTSYIALIRQPRDLNVQLCALDLVGAALLIHVDESIVYSLMQLLSPESMRCASTPQVCHTFAKIIRGEPFKRQPASVKNPQIGTLQVRVEVLYQNLLDWLREESAIRSEARSSFSGSPPGDSLFSMTYQSMSLEEEDAIDREMTSTTLLLPLSPQASPPSTMAAPPSPSLLLLRGVAELEDGLLAMDNRTTSMNLAPLLLGSEGARRVGLGLLRSMVKYNPNPPEELVALRANACDTMHHVVSVMLRPPIFESVVKLLEKDEHSLRRFVQANGVTRSLELFRLALQGNHVGEQRHQVVDSDRERMERSLDLDSFHSGTELDGSRTLRSSAHVSKRLATVVRVTMILLSLLPPHDLQGAVNQLNIVIRDSPQYFNMETYVVVAQGVIDAATCNFDPEPNTTSKRFGALVVSYPFAASKPMILDLASSLLTIATVNREDFLQALIHVVSHTYNINSSILFEMAKSGVAPQLMPYIEVPDSRLKELVVDRHIDSNTLDMWEPLLRNRTHFSRLQFRREGGLVIGCPPMPQMSCTLSFWYFFAHATPVMPLVGICGLQAQTVLQLQLREKGIHACAKGTNIRVNDAALRHTGEDRWFHYAVALTEDTLAVFIMGEEIGRIALPQGMRMSSESPLTFKVGIFSDTREVDVFSIGHVSLWNKAVTSTDFMVDLYGNEEWTRLSKIHPSEVFCSVGRRIPDAYRIAIFRPHMHNVDRSLINLANSEGCTAQIVGRCCDPPEGLHNYHWLFVTRGGFGCLLDLLDHASQISEQAHKTREAQLQRVLELTIDCVRQVNALVTLRARYYGLIAFYVRRTGKSMTAKLARSLFSMAAERGDSGDVMCINRYAFEYILADMDMYAALPENVACSLLSSMRSAFVDSSSNAASETQKRNAQFLKQQFLFRFAYGVVAMHASLGESVLNAALAVVWGFLLADGFSLASLRVIVSVLPLTSMDDPEGMEKESPKKALVMSTILKFCARCAGMRGSVSENCASAMTPAAVCLALCSGKNMPSCRVPALTLWMALMNVWSPKIDYDTSFRCALSHVLQDERLLLMMLCFAVGRPIPVDTPLADMAQVAGDALEDTGKYCLKPRLLAMTMSILSERVAVGISTPIFDVASRSLQAMANVESLFVALVAIPDTIALAAKFINAPTTSIAPFSASICPIDAPPQPTATSEVSRDGEAREAVVSSECETPHALGDEDAVASSIVLESPATPLLEAPPSDMPLPPNPTMDSGALFTEALLRSSLLRNSIFPQCKIRDPYGTFASLLVRLLVRSQFEVKSMTRAANVIASFSHCEMELRAPCQFLVALLTFRASSERPVVELPEMARVLEGLFAALSSPNRRWPSDEGLRVAMELLLRFAEMNDSTEHQIALLQAALQCVKSFFTSNTSQHTTRKQLLAVIVKGMQRAPSDPTIVKLLEDIMFAVLYVDHHLLTACLTECPPFLQLAEAVVVENAAERAALHDLCTRPDIHRWMEESRSWSALKDYLRHRHAVVSSLGRKISVVFTTLPDVVLPDAEAKKKLIASLVAQYSSRVVDLTPLTPEDAVWLQLVDCARERDVAGSNITAQCFIDTQRNTVPHFFASHTPDVVEPRALSEFTTHLSLLFPAYFRAIPPYFDDDRSWVKTTQRLTPSALTILRYCVTPSETLEYVGNAFKVSGLDVIPVLIVLTNATMKLYAFSCLTDGGDVMFAENQVISSAGLSMSSSGSIGPKQITSMIRDMLAPRTRSGTHVARAVRNLNTRAASSKRCLFWVYYLVGIVDLRLSSYLHQEAAVDIRMAFDDGPFLAIVDTKMDMCLKARREFLHALQSQLRQSINVEPRDERLSQATKQWQMRNLSNYDYILTLNRLAGRTIKDINQYPIMPWVLKDYESPLIDLSQAGVYRDLMWPIHCQSDAQRAEADRRFAVAQECGEIPCYHCSHYSTSGGVLHFMVRAQPYTTYSYLFHDHGFDHANRMFRDMALSFKSATSSSGDCKELTPDFYGMNTAFLKNNNQLDLGTTQEGVVLGDVSLPPWANGCPRRFLSIQRQALESEKVSEHLHQWIDLIFGVARDGEAAARAKNVFRPLSYAEGVRARLAEKTDPVEHDRITSEAYNFGQTPKKLFEREHPPRGPAPKPTHLLRYLSHLDEVHTVASSPPCALAHLPVGLNVTRSIHGFVETETGSWVAATDGVYPVEKGNHVLCVEERRCSIRRYPLHTHATGGAVPHGIGVPFALPYDRTITALLIGPRECVVLVGDSAGYVYALSPHAELTFSCGMDAHRSPIAAIVGHPHGCRVVTIAKDPHDPPAVWRCHRHHTAFLHRLRIPPWAVGGSGGGGAMGSGGGGGGGAVGSGVGGGGGGAASASTPTPPPLPTTLPPAHHPPPPRGVATPLSTTSTLSTMPASWAPTGAEGVVCAAIDGRDGCVVVCTGSHVVMFDVNGEVLGSAESTAPSPITAVCVVETFEWANGATIAFTGHANGFVGTWSIARVPPDTAAVVSPSTASDGASSIAGGERVACLVRIELVATTKVDAAGGGITALRATSPPLRIFVGTERGATMTIHHQPRLE